MDFTREPIIESIITAKDGHRIVVRSSKNVGHEEYFVDALEVISFGSSIFFRCSERPRPFLVPATDYEVLEVREPRVALKAPSIAGTVRIGPAKETKEVTKETSKESGKEQSFSKNSKEPKSVREVASVKEELLPVESESEIELPPQPKEFEPVQEENDLAPQNEKLVERKKDRRARLRKRKGGREDFSAPSTSETETPPAVALTKVDGESAKASSAAPTTTLLPPPTTLIRDDIERLRKNDSFRGAFYMKDDQTQEKEGDDDEAPVIPERLIMQDEESGEELPHDSYKATPAKEVIRDFREPFWIPPRVEEQPKPPEGV